MKLALAALSALFVTAAPGVPSRMLAGLPDVMQANSYSCGVGAVQAVAQFYGVWGYHETYAEALGTSSENGTHPRAIEAYLRKLGLDARLVEGLTIADLRRYVDAGVPVIIDYQAWNGGARPDYAHAWEDGHYSVVVGYNRGHVFIEDPSLLGTVGWLTDAELEARWHDYETEKGQRREYRRMGIVVRGKPVKGPAYTHID
jgi:predicted double-glycine peptidase